MNIENLKPENVAAQILDEQPQDMLSVQEAANRYGITLPAPSATDPIPELRGVLDTLARKVVAVFTPYIDTLLLRVANLRDSIRQTNAYVTDAYTWLLARLDHTYLLPPSLPEPQDAQHLAANLQSALDNRRISNGTGSQVPDGISLARFYARYRTTLTELIDDNYDNISINGFFTEHFLNQGDTPWLAVRKIVTYAKSATVPIGLSLYYNYTNMRVELAYMETVPANLWTYSASDSSQYPAGEGEPITSDKYRSGGFTSGKMHILRATTSAVTSVANGMSFCTFAQLFLYRFARGYLRLGGSHANNYDHSPTTYVLVGCTGYKTDSIHLYCHTTVNNVITDIEIGDKENIDAGLEPRWLPCQNLTILNIEGLTAANIYSHILQRLKQDEADCGDGVTITLGATNLAKLEDEQHPEYASLLAELRTTYKYTFA